MLLIYEGLTDSIADKNKNFTISKQVLKCLYRYM